MAQSRLLIQIASASALLLAAAIVHTSAAQKSVPRTQDNLAIAEEQVKQLLPLMTSDPHGKLSRQEYMHFMEAEFDRLDKDKKGELDVRAITQSNYATANRFAGK
ncbi:MAG TPA: hypothetical protein VMJ35_12120 [Dongiaceae bacterium]|nr:hypothetical protein [Dongiaceae bacterium]